MKPYLNFGGQDLSDGLQQSVIAASCGYIDKPSIYDRNVIIEIECKTSETFVDTLRKISQNCALNLFRGHRDATWQLLPTAHREDSWIGPIVAMNLTDGIEKLAPYRWGEESDEKYKRRVELALRRFFQNQLVYVYQELAIEWGIEGQTSLACDSEDAGPASSDYKQLTSFMASTQIPWFEARNLYVQIAAQHHGVHTPLLDFTSSFEIAADFATRDTRVDGGSHIAIWAIVDSPPFNFYHRFGVDSPYLQRQKSYMLLNSSADLFYYESGDWLPFETRLANTMPLGSVFKITMEHSDLESLRNRLGIIYSPLYMLGTPAYETSESVRQRVECLKTAFCNEVQSRVQSQLDWGQVMIEQSPNDAAMEDTTDYCNFRCNNHCNTMFSQTFK